MCGRAQGGMHPAAGIDSNFIIGGSNWESGAGWQTAAEAKAWSEAGFLAVSLPAVCNALSDISTRIYAA